MDIGLRVALYGGEIQTVWNVRLFINLASDRRLCSHILFPSQCMLHAVDWLVSFIIFSPGYLMNGATSLIGFCCCFCESWKQS